MRTNIKSKTGLYFFGGVFVFVGILVSALMLFIAKSEANKMKEWEATEAFIQDITKNTYRRNGKRKTDYDVYIAYAYGGSEYEDELNYYSSSMDIGDKITIYVNPENPNEQTDGNSFTFLLIGTIFGITFPLVGIYVIIATIKGKVVYVEGSLHSKL